MTQSSEKKRGLSQLSIQNAMSSLQEFIEIEDFGCSWGSARTEDGGVKTGIEIYSIGFRSDVRCEFIAPHSVEALVGTGEGKPVNVLYFAPSKCACIHCLLSEAGGRANVGTSCLS
jgi:hypothetical protein